MEYAVEVETYTLSKANNLVMNVDGAIGTLFMDLLAGSGMFTKQEIDEIVSIGCLGPLHWSYRVSIIHAYISISNSYQASISPNENSLFTKCD